jgi:fucose permease
MAGKSIKLNHLIPLMVAYVVMGFVDIVGVSTGFIQRDFNISADLAQLIPAMVFLWFFLLSVPVGILQDKLGKRKMLNIGMFISGLGMILPFIHYSFPVMLLAFIFLGIGNTIVQVPINPLLHDIVPREKYSSFMSFTQFLKAISSLMGPVITTFVAIKFNNWKLVFAIYSMVSFITVIWMYFTQIEESKPECEAASFKSSVKLLKNRFVFFLVLGIFLSVGAEVGINSNLANYLKNIFQLSLEDASLNISIYYAALMIGRFAGAILLNWVIPRKFLLYTVILAFVGILILVFSPTLTVAKIAIFMTGLGSANLFPIMFTININKNPGRANELSGLMIMSVVGGAVIPPLMGIATVNFGIWYSMLIPVFCIVYILSLSISLLRKGLIPENE